MAAFVEGSRWSTLGRYWASVTGWKSAPPPPMPPDVPPAARAVVERAMNKRPADRYPNAAAFAQEARLVAAQLARKPSSPTAGPVRRALSAILDWGGRATRT